MKIRCDINGLDCPHCALELEGQIAKHPEINAANINYALHSLVLEVADGTDEDALVEKVQAIADNFSDGIEIEIRD